MAGAHFIADLKSLLTLGELAVANLAMVLAVSAVLSLAYFAMIVTERSR